MVSPKLLRILFASSYCLLDTTSGAAVNMHGLLEGLLDRGFVAEALTASIFDPAEEVSLESFLGSGHEVRRVLPQVLEITAGRLQHTVLRTASSRRSSCTAREEEVLLSLLESTMRRFRPDILLTYGGLSLERNMHRLARREGLVVVFFLANGLYTKAETFGDVDQILVPSKFLRGYYQERLGIRSRVLYPMVSRERCQAARVEGRFVTLINPVPQKGVGLFVRLASEAMTRLPTAEFLAVEGRWTKKDLVRAGLRVDALSNVKFLANQADMTPVYGCTKILLFPSLWEESFGQSIVEAQLNGIPVLASPRGGIPEALNGAGFLLDVPERCVRDHRRIPTAAEVQPWIERLRALLEDPGAYEEARRRAWKAAEAFSPETTLEAAAEIFRTCLIGK